MDINLAALTSAEMIRTWLFLQVTYLILFGILCAFLLLRRPSTEVRRTALLRLGVFYGIIHVTVACLALGGAILRLAAAALALSACRDLFGILQPAETRVLRAQRWLACAAAAALVLLMPGTEANALAFVGGVACVTLALPVFFADPRNTLRGASDAVFVIAVAGGLPYLLVWLAERRDGTAITALVACVLTDAFSEASGRFFGKRPWLPALSPNKTLEGSMGGILLGTAGTALFQSLVGQLSLSFLGVALLLCVSAHVGDLAFSALKRSAGTKDFSGMIPGHGGVLDRFDSLLFACSTLVVYLRLTE